MAYIKNFNRSQIMLFPPSIDELVDDNNEVRVIDAFVDSLDLASLGFSKSNPHSSGAPSYDPKDLLKIYLYSYPKKIRSSRRIADEVKRNIELIWLTNGLHPDFRTISDFRKDNISSIKKVLKQFNELCLELNIFSRELSSLDGSKFKAVNSKDNNFTKDKLKDRLKRLNKNIDEYLKALESSDTNDTLSTNTTDDITSKLKFAREKACEYNKYLNDICDAKENQISLTDKDSRLMKCNGSMLVGFNVQSNVDVKSHIITSISVSNKPNDNGVMKDCGNVVKDDFKVDKVELLADGGYIDKDDIKNCLEERIVPILPDGEYYISYDYNEDDITDEVRKGKNKEDIKKCFENGIIPNCYDDLNIEASIEEEHITVNVNAIINEDDVDKLKDKAKEGFFVRDKKHNCIYCPYGNTLDFKRSTGENDIFVGNSNCLNCKNKCTKHHVKELSIPKDKDITACNIFKKRVPVKMVTTTKKKVVIKYIPDKEKYKLRKNTSEHPFGTLKRAHDASYFLLKGVDKVEGELTLSVLGYNFKRLINIVGVDKLLDHLKNKIICSN